MEYLIRPSLVSEIDAFATKELSLSEQMLILRAGEAVAEEISARVAPSGVLIFCGCGNNGADGYATALSLAARGFSPLAVDVFGCGQRTEGGRAVLAAYCARFGSPLTLAEAAEKEAAVTVDALLGTGAHGPFSGVVSEAAAVMRARSGFHVAIDLPLGVDADYGELWEGAVKADLTVMLSFAKRGLLSYPAKEMCGELVTASIGLAVREVTDAFPLVPLPSDAYARAAMPPRATNSHKGSFGRLRIYAGSEVYRGALRLALSAALRSGVGLVHVCTASSLSDALVAEYPEAIYEPAPAFSEMTEEEMETELSRTQKADALLIGPGCGVSEGLYRFVLALLSRQGGTLVLDADALGALALHPEKAQSALREARRPVLLTPHPLELARLIGKTVPEVQSARIRVAEEYAARWGVGLLLKGAGTVIATPDALTVNPSGSSALAKGGSGDVLAGLVGSLAAQGALPFDALALGAYLHGCAGDTLSSRYSLYGVTPSDLPLAIAEQIARIFK